jgi:hypothetical protein
MAADPEPRDLIALKQPNRAVPKGDAHRVDRFSGVNLLELQAGMVGVLSKELLGLPGGLANAFGKVVVRCPEARCAA